MDIGEQLRALLGDAKAAIANVQKQFNDVSSNITSSWKEFDAAMSKAMTGPAPSAVLTNTANGVNELYTKGNIEGYFTNRGKAAAAGYNRMADNHGADRISANIDTSHENVSHDSNADTESLEINPDFAHQAIVSLKKLMETVSSAGGQAINVNILGAEAIDTAIIENGKRNMERLNGNFSEIVKLMEDNFKNLQDADRQALSDIVSKLNED